METNLNDIYDLIEHAIDYAFEGKINLKFYDYLRANKVKKHEIDLFIDSSTVLELNDIIKDLGEYIEGGADNQHKQPSVTKKQLVHATPGCQWSGLVCKRFVWLLFR